MARKAVRWMDGRRCLQAQPGTDANLPHVNRRRDEPAVRKILRPHVATARIQQAGSSNLIHLQRAGADADVEAARDVQHVRRIVQAARPRIGQQRARQAGAQAAGVAPLQVCHVAAQLPHQPAMWISLFSVVCGDALNLWQPCKAPCRCPAAAPACQP